MNTAQEIISRCEKVESDWTNARNLWRNAGLYTLPEACNLLIPPAQAIQTQGQEKTVHLYDTTSGDANKKLAAGLFSYLFPVNERPFALRAEPEELNENHAVATALSKMTTITQQHLANSNFPLQFFSFLEEFGCYGGGCIYSERNRRPVSSSLNFKNIHLLNVVVLVDSNGNVDTAFYRFAFTPRQAVQEWCPDRTSVTIERILGKELATAYADNKQIDRPFDFIHAVYPREDRKPRKTDKSNKPFASTYVCVEGKKKIGDTDSGYDEMPYHLTWFWKSTNEQTGRGPGTETLPEIRMINRMRVTFIKGSEKQCDPPLMVPDDGALTPYFTQPGGIITYRPGLRKDDFWPLETHVDTRLTKEVLEGQAAIIKRRFFNDLFQVLEDYRNMTAREVVERVDEKLRLLGPAVGRLQRELFTPMITRSVKILARAGAFPFLEEVVEELKGVSFKVEYTGKLALAVKELEGHAISKTIATLNGLFANRPDTLDNFDEDKIARDTALNDGSPADWLRPTEVRDEIRRQRNEIEQLKLMAEIGKTGADALKNLGKGVDPTSILAGLKETA